LSQQLEQTAPVDLNIDGIMAIENPHERQGTLVELFDDLLKAENADHCLSVALKMNAKYNNTYIYQSCQLFVLQGNLRKMHSILQYLPMHQHEDIAEMFKSRIELTELHEFVTKAQQMPDDRLAQTILRRLLLQPAPAAAPLEAKDYS